MSDFLINYRRTSASAQDIKSRSREIRHLADTIKSCDRALNSSGLNVEIHYVLNQLLKETLEVAAKEVSIAAALQHISALYASTEKTLRTSVKFDTKLILISNSKTNRSGTDKRGRLRKIIDDIFNRKIDTSKTATTAEQEAAADKEMKKKAVNLRNQYRYSEKAWKKASFEERKKILTDYMHDVEKILGVDVSDKINWTYSEPENGLINHGSYNHGTKQVSINEYVLKRKDSYHLMTTITHELRHAYQHYAIDHPDQFRVTQETIDSWKESFRTYTTEQNKGYESYRNIVVEKDARWFAGQN